VHIPSLHMSDQSFDELRCLVESSAAPGRAFITASGVAVVRGCVIMHALVQICSHVQLNFFTQGDYSPMKCRECISLQ
jgi:hypothetical protein